MTRIIKKIGFSYKKTPDIDIVTLPCPAEEPNVNSSLMNWVLWYADKEIAGIGSTLSQDAKMDDLQKFINYFNDMHPGGNWGAWQKALTEGFLDALKHDGYAKTSISRIYTTVKALSKYLERKLIVDPEDSPFHKIKGPKIPEVPAKTAVLKRGRDILSEGSSVVNLVLAAADSVIGQNNDKREMPYRNKALIAALYHSGLRITEICSIDMTQLKNHPKTGGMIFLSVQCKAGATRGEVFCDKTGTKIIKEYIECERNDIMDEETGPLFISRTGKRMTRSGAWKIIRRMVRLAENELEKGSRIVLSPHILRHERTYRLVDHGLKENEVAEEMGHKDTRQIKRYAKRSTDHRYKVLNEID